MPISYMGSIDRSFLGKHDQATDGSGFRVRAILLVVSRG